MQKSYRITVSKDGELQWDTGVVETDCSLYIPYVGETLLPRSRYAVRENILDQHGERACAEGFFETGLMAYENFKAGWITHGFADDLEPCAVFVKRFPAGKEVAKARAYVSALGLYEMTQNGDRVSDANFTPGWTSYQRRLQYQTYDITNQLKECYTHIAAPTDTQAAEGASFSEIWCPVCKSGTHGMRMIRHTGKGPESALLYIHRFCFAVPYKIKDAQMFMQQDGSYENITSVPGRLRWCRHKAGLLQTEVAESVGISEGAYKALEEGTAQHISKDVAERLAQLYQRPVTDFIDEYNQFLYDGQARRIAAYRAKLGMKRKPFARAMGIPIRSLQEWESGKKVISRQCWERYFKNKA